MRKYRFITPILLGLSLIPLAAVSPHAKAAAPEAQAPAAGMARVWFMRTSDSTNGNVEGAAPVVFANGAALGSLPAGADFYRDFPAGTYRFTVQSYGLPTPQADTVQLTAGTQTYLQVQWAPTWEEGYAQGTGNDSHSFFVLAMSPQLAEAYLPSLTYLGQRRTLVAGRSRSRACRPGSVLLIRFISSCNNPGSSEASLPLRDYLQALALRDVHTLNLVFSHKT